MFAAELFAVQLLNGIILQYHNPSCISGVKIHLQMMHNGVNLVVESDFLPYSKGFYIIYLHIYIWNSINELFDISLLLNFFSKKKPQSKLGLWSNEQADIAHWGLFGG